MVKCPECGKEVEKDTEGTRTNDKIRRKVIVRYYSCWDCKLAWKEDVGVVEIPIE